MKKLRYVIQFELTNKQEDYLLCYKNIKEIERYFENSDEERREENLTEALSKAKGRFISEKNITFHNKIIEIDEQIRFPSITISDLKGKISDLDKFKEICLKDFNNEKEKVDKPIYYLRIACKDTDNIMNLQFYNIMEILLKKDYPKFENFRIFGFYGPVVLEGEKLNCTYYYRIRDYLRCIEQGFNNIYAYKEFKKEIKINRVKNDSGIRSYKFLPLFEVDEDLLEVLRKNFDVDIADWQRTYRNSEIKDYKLSFSNNTTNSEKKIVSQNRKEMEGWLNNFLEKSIFPPKMRNKMNEEELADCYNVIAELCKKYKIGLFEVALLTTFLTRDAFDSSGKIEKIFDSVKSLSNGIFQVIENSIYHTSLKKCFFSFRLLEKKHLAQINDNYGIEDVSSDQRFLEIFITDLNLEENIISNFCKKIEKKDKNMTLMERELYKRKNEIKVSDFLKDYNYSSNGLESIWKNYRNENNLQCLGLPIFSDTVQLYNGIIKLKSCTETRVKNGEDIYVKNYFCTSKNLEEEYFSKEHFPGTQVSILIPIPHNFDKLNNANIQFSRTLIENGKSLAKFIDYHAEKINWEKFKKVKFNNEIIDIEIGLNNIESCNKAIEEVLADIVISHNKKQNRINIWEECIIQCVNPREEQLEYIDLSNYIIDYMEEFCKAFIKCLVTSENLKYFAFINCTVEFINTFCKILCQSYPNFKNKKQIFLATESADVAVLIAGNNWIQNAINYTLTNGRTAQLSKLFELKQKLLKIEERGWSEKIEVLPFTSLIVVDPKTNKTLFDENIEKISEKNLLETDTAGYKLDDTHMRLGSKVHLDSFYEVSILFQKPKIAKRIAFQIFKRIMNGNKNTFKGNIKIMFYGYASYSRSILNALIEISDQYSNNGKNIKIISEFAVYQNDIPVQSATLFSGSEVKIYFSKKDKDGNEQKKKIDKSTYIVQIVPISTTLTTFSKMWNKFEAETVGAPNNPNLNFTYFWVRNKEREENEVRNIEDTFFKEESNIIESFFCKPNPIIFIEKRVKWLDPLDCKLCFPKKPRDEKILFETDSTSTIPTQQIEPIIINNDSERLVQKLKNEDIKNEERVLNLKNCVKYGHFYRDTNHYQFYIDTSVYFQNEKINIEEWLKDEHNKDSDEIVFKDEVLNVIVTPQHHTNVEFCQCVNNNYFDGNAEVITIDSRKEYRTNFEVKYSDLKLAFNYHVEKGIGVFFHYVDDSIISGTTYLRVNNLLRTIIPKNNENVILFSKIFVLVNRLSDGSKEGYIKNRSKNFHSFCDLNISSMRTIGDACTICKVKQTARKLYERSATKEISQYWNKKLYDYEEISFDAELTEYYRDMQLIGYFRMLCSHRAKSLLDEKEENNKNMKKFYEQKILQIFEEIFLIEKEQHYPNEELNSSTKKVIGNQMEFSPIQVELSKDVLLALKTYLKIFSRPFFSYNNSIKQSFLNLLLGLTEGFLKKKVQRVEVKNSDYSWPNSIISKINSSDDSIDFLKKYLLEGVADLKSNYLIRRETFLNIIKYIEENADSNEKIDNFYSDYAILIHRLINDSSDETKCLWFEYLLVTGSEYKIYNNINGPCKSKEVAEKMFIEVGLNSEVRSFEKFVKFWDNLLIENTRLYFEGINEFKNEIQQLLSNQGSEEFHNIFENIMELQPQYYMANFFKFLCIDFGLSPELEEKQLPKKIIKTIKDVLELYMLLTSTENNSDRYHGLQKKIKLVVNGNDVYILSRTKDEINQLSYYYIAGEEVSNSSVLNEVETLMCQSNFKNGVDLEKELKKYGYYISTENEFILIYLCNNHDFLKNESLLYLDEIQKIDPLIIYIKLKGSKIDLKVFVRRILMFRKLIIKWLEDDFNNNALSNLSKQAWINARLSKEKAGDHISNNDLEIIMKELRLSEKANCEANTESEVNKTRKWLLLRSYVNMRIARLYRAFLACDCGNKNEKEKIFKRIYREIDSDNKNQSDPVFENFGILFENLNDNESVGNYFELITPIVSIHCNFYGKETSSDKNKNIEEGKKSLAEAFNDLNCVNRETKGYRTEFMACIILDIIFSCIRESIDWESVLYNDLKLKEEIETLMAKLDPENVDEVYLKHTYMLETEGDTRFQYWFLKNSEGEKLCELSISTEERGDSEDYDYLIFKNRKALKRNTPDDIEKLREKLIKSINQDDSKGFSLLTIKWYIEKLWVDSENPPNVEFDYIQEGKDILFEIKLPILKKRNLVN